LKKAPHEAGPKARNNNTYKQISIGLASPQYALAEPVNQRDLALGTTIPSRRLERRNSAPDLPADFDPGLHRILARHWFGIELQDVRDLWWRQARL
jgi:hypothetical protein